MIVCFQVFSCQIALVKQKCFSVPWQCCQGAMRAFQNDNSCLTEAYFEGLLWTLGRKLPGRIGGELICDALRSVLGC